MHKIFILIIVLISFPRFSSAQVKFVKTSILNNKVDIVIPTVLRTMTKEEISKYFPHWTEIPELVLMDSTGNVSLIGDYTPEKILEKELSGYKDFQMSELTKIHPDLEWLQNGIKTVNHRKIAYFGGISKVEEQEVYSYYFITILRGKVLLFTFNCNGLSRHIWEKTLDVIVASLKLK